jgi:hypothetical protein
MSTRKSPTRRGAKAAAKSAVSRKTGTDSNRRGVRAATHVAAGQSVTMQARVDAGFARTLIERDAAVLGLSGPSELVREGLRLLHERAREAEMAAAYDDFYRGERAPLPAGVAPADRG